MSNLNLVATTTDATVVSEYTPEKRKSEAYESEAALEKELISILVDQGYERLNIHTEAELIDNLRFQIEKLNKYKFSDDEWTRFFNGYIAKPNDGIVEKTRTIQVDNVKTLIRDDGNSKNITLIDKRNVHNNSVQVLNQYEVEGKYNNRYDVTILVNGLPLVHIELKRRGVAIREAFNQIERYQRDSFWAGNGLFEYVQIFVISNGTRTKYYSNTTRWRHTENGAKKGKSSNSFEFTSFWADGNNKCIYDIIDFAHTFLTKHVLLNVLTKYCVFTAEESLLVMRPYQIAATERIINRIEITNNLKRYSCPEAGGYIWHTTGSGKTLTSFKTAQLASKLEYIDKVIFVVDRKDLDYQTMKEYDRFEKGAANSNKSTAILKKQLEDDNCKIIITTIQKLSIFCKQNKGHEAFNKHIVLIFDECHRSQFGEFNKNVTKAFKKYHLFGFTGTPIFTENANGSANAMAMTTAQVFGDLLHTYTIIDAINDQNVLPFKVDYISTFRSKEIEDEEIQAIDRDKALKDPKRISEIVEYILKHFKQKTKRNEVYVHANTKKATRGFNSIFAVASIDFAKAYYEEFKKQQLQLEDKDKLKVALIYSYGVNNEVSDDFIDDENNEDTSNLNAADRDFLENAIQDYNLMFHTQFDTSSDRFQNYYKDLSMRVKNQEVDLLIVVNMFLTGFDATTLNTLWVDKNLKYHGLLQSYSRTNRILNSIKTFGNIICFRNLEKATKDALALFGNKDAGGVMILRPYSDYLNGYTSDGKHYDGYLEVISKLDTKFDLSDPETLLGETKEKDFIKTVSLLLKLRNILTAFDEFEDPLPERKLQDYISTYTDLYDKYRNKDKAEKEEINDDLIFEIELVKQIEVNIDYILKLIEEYNKSGKTNKEVRASIDSAVNASLGLRSKIELIHSFIQSVEGNVDVGKAWQEYVKEKVVKDLDEIILEEKLNKDETYIFMQNAIENGYINTLGTNLDALLPPMTRFGGSNREATKAKIIDKLKAFFDKYWDLNVELIEREVK